MVNYLKSVIFQLSLILILVCHFLITGIAANQFQLPSLIKSFEIYHDSLNLEFYEVSNLSSTDFKDYRGEVLLRHNVYWLKVRVDNFEAKGENYFIHFNSLISDITLFQQDDTGKLIKNRGGSLVPERQRTVGGLIKDKVSFLISEGEETEVFIRLCTKLERKYSLNNLAIVTFKDYNDLVFKSYLTQNFFFGIVTILIILNLTLFILTRDKVYLFYFVYMSVTTLFFVHYYQLSEKYLLYNFPRLDLSLFISIAVLQAVYLWFFDNLLKPENLPVWKKIIRKFAWINSTICLLMIIMGIFDLHLAIVIIDYLILLNGVFVLIMYNSLYRKVRPTIKIILTGSLFLVAGGLASTIADFSKISTSHVIYFQAGVFVELVLFTIGINFMYNKERTDKLEALLYNSQLEAHQLKKEKEAKALKREIDFKTRDLATKSVILSEKEMLIKQVIGQLGGLSQKGQENAHVEEVMKSLKFNSQSSNWNEFEVYFNDIHPSFYNRLNRVYPGLSVNERKLCAFLKLNLSTKQIAAISGKSENTIDVARSRLRRKMKLKSNENLAVVVSSLG